jgi:hypothetical protein
VFSAASLSGDAEYHKSVIPAAAGPFCLGRRCGASSVVLGVPASWPKGEVIATEFVVTAGMHCHRLRLLALVLVPLLSLFRRRRAPTRPVRRRPALVLKSSPWKQHLHAFNRLKAGASSCRWSRCRSTRTVRVSARLVLDPSPAAEVSFFNCVGAHPHSRAWPSAA